ncbi:MAG: 5'-3' exonuclease H3TH domain-containing protein, partial [Planctomycetota bacterium]|nr:5'-3' exonuclease H3TH domain-containing protein [Planctomycetota bacterium]
DALATAACVLYDEPAFEQVVVCTTDTDLYQTIRGERVVCLDRIRKQVTDGAALKQKLGIEGRQFPDYLALVGAPAKGIPGVPGFGGKSTAALLKAFDTLEAIPNSADAWPEGIRSAARLAEALRAQREEAQLIKDLATLRTDLPIDCSAEALRWRSVDHERLDAVIAATECEDLRPRLERWDAYAHGR